MQQVDVDPRHLARLAALLPPPRAARLQAVAERCRARLAHRTIWHVNATARGGGVAEMLQTLLAYGADAGVDTRWLVLDGDPDFYALTKGLHNLLHGHGSDEDAARLANGAAYDAVSESNLRSLLARVRRDDLVVLHDPQTAGLAHGLVAAGIPVVWRCHIGSDTGNARTEAAWAFLQARLDAVDAFIFSRRQFAPAWVHPSRLFVIPPSIDPFSSKNQELDPATVTAILTTAGLVAGPSQAAAVTVAGNDGTSHVVRRRAVGALVDDPPPADAPLVTQVSRWDRLKDMPGVMAGFAAAIADQADDVHLMLLGPAVTDVSDDPEGAAVLAECREQWRALPPGLRGRVHLASIPIDDLDENALIVNAVQRHANVVVQKSLAEGFGLTVTEAMWKGKPVIAGRVGGIQDQIVDGRDGVLVDDPHDIESFARALRHVLDDPTGAARLGAAAHERVQDQYLADRHLVQYAELLEHVAGGDPEVARDER